MSCFVQAILTGLVMGGVYALVATGLTLIMGIMKIINVAHGEFLMLAMYGSFFMHSLLKLDPYVSIVIILPLFFLFGCGFFRFFISPIISSRPSTLVFMTLGISIFLQNLALLLFTADYRSIALEYSKIKFKLGPGVIDLPQIIVFLTSIAVTFVFYWLMKSTDIGRCIRAVSQNKEASILTGVNVLRIYLFTFGIGTASVGIAGALLSSIYYITPTVGLVFLLAAFAVVVLGGLGNFLGALIGSFIIAMAESIGAIFIPIGLVPIMKFIIFIGILLFMPQGLFGTKQRL